MRSLLCRALLFLPAAQDAAAPSAAETLTLRGWTVHLGAQWAERTELKALVLALLRAQLSEVAARLPGPVVERLREVPIRMHLEREGCPGGVYHPSADGLAEHDPGLVEVLKEVWADLPETAADDQGVWPGNPFNCCGCEAPRPPIQPRRRLPASSWH
jgi:hypothetical protein